MNYFRKNRRTIISLDQLLEEKKFEVEGEGTPRNDLAEAYDELEKHQDFLKIQQHLIKLPSHYQTVIALKFFEKKKIKEIAEILGKKEGTVKSLLSRGLEQLRRLMEMQPSSKPNVIKS